MLHDWSPLAEGRIPRVYHSGELVYLQGTEPDVFYLLISGSVRSFISSPEGVERVLTVHHSGDLMGEASFFDQCPRVSSAVAIAKSQIVSVSSTRLTTVFSQQPELALSMLQYLARTVRLLSSHVDDISFRPARARVIRYLLSLYRGLPIPCTHEEIGSAVGVSRVTVSRVLGELTQHGWIQTGYGTIMMLEPEKLQNCVLTQEKREP